MELTPKQASGLAESMYTLSRSASFEECIKLLNNEYQGKIVFSENQILKGKTGGPGFIKVRTGFGFLLVGKENLADKVFVIFRGTQYLADWLTNFNVTVAKSDCGQPVHDGFKQAFDSMLPQIKPFIDELPPGVSIHCIGHSLGGALATIAAEWIVSAHKHKPYLYTFGSPRVGLHGFAANCTKSIGEN